jgi:hypothetical protein
MDDSLSASPFGEKEIRCPRLGGPVTFEYCRVERQSLPCSRAIECWCNCFDVEAFFRQALNAAEFKESFETPAQPRVVALVELIEKAREAARNKQDT